MNLPSSPNIIKPQILSVLLDKGLRGWTHWQTNIRITTTKLTTAITANPDKPVSQRPPLLKLHHVIVSTITIIQSLHKSGKTWYPRLNNENFKGRDFVSLHSDSKPLLQTRHRNYFMHTRTRRLKNNKIAKKINVATSKDSAKRRKHSKANMEMAWNGKCWGNTGKLKSYNHTMNIYKSLVKNEIGYRESRPI